MLRSKVRMLQISYNGEVETRRSGCKKRKISRNTFPSIRKQCQITPSGQSGYIDNPEMVEVHCRFLHDLAIVYIKHIVTAEMVVIKIRRWEYGYH